MTAYARRYSIVIFVLQTARGLCVGSFFYLFIMLFSSFPCGLSGNLQSLFILTPVLLSWNYQLSTVTVHSLIPSFY